jgi:hypothetical protein
MVPGAHILSGNVFCPVALNELIPNWKEREVTWRRPRCRCACSALHARTSLAAPAAPASVTNDSRSRQPCSR